MYELKKFGKKFTSKCVGTGPSSYKKRIYQAAVSQKLRNTGIERKVSRYVVFSIPLKCGIGKFKQICEHIHIFVYNWPN